MFGNMDGSICCVENFAPGIKVNRKKKGQHLNRQN